MPIVQCPECEKKLKLNNAVPGKKVRCPGCKSPFVPVPAKKTKAGPSKRRKSPPPEDDYEDDAYGEDDGYEETPAPRKRRSGAAAASGGRGRKSSKKRTKAASDKKSKAPLLIGIGVVAAIAIGAGVMFMLGGNDEGDSIAESDGNGAATAGEGQAENTGDGEHDAENSGDEHQDNAEAQPTAVAQNDAATDSASGDNVPSNNQAAAQDASVDETMNMFSSVPGSGTDASQNAFSSSTSMPSVDLSSVTLASNSAYAYLPPNSEVIATLSVAELMEGPLGVLAQQPEIAEAIAEGEEQLGVKLTDVESVTLGIGEFMKAAAEEREPEKEEIVGALRLQLKTSVELSQIESLIQGSELQSAGNFSYLKVPAPDGEAAAVFLADAKTLVLTAERMLPIVASSSGPSLDTTLLDGQSSLQIAFAPVSPSDLQKILSKQQLPPTLPPPMQTIVRNAMGSMTAASIGVELSKDLGFTMMMESNDSQVAKQTADSLRQLNEMGKQNVDMQVQQVAAVPLVGPMLGDIVRELTNNQTVTLDGNRIRMASDSKGAGSKLAPMVSMGYSMMLQPAILQARTAAKRAVEQNNLRMIGLAMFGFYDFWPTERFPNSTPRSDDGQPLLSWRVHLLPFVGQETLYKKFNLEEPWDSPQNIALLEEMPDVYKSDEDTPRGFTTYLAVTGPGTAFEDGVGRSMTDFLDGTSNTVLVVDVSASAAVEWTKPVDWEFDPASPMKSLDRKETGAKVLLADGTVKELRSSQQAFKMMTRAAGD